MISLSEKMYGKGGGQGKKEILIGERRGKGPGQWGATLDEGVKKDITSLRRSQ